MLTPMLAEWYRGRCPRPSLGSLDARRRGDRVAQFRQRTLLQCSRGVLTPFGPETSAQVAMQYLYRRIAGIRDRHAEMHEQVPAYIASSRPRSGVRVGSGFVVGSSVSLGR